MYNILETSNSFLLFIIAVLASLLFYLLIYFKRKLNDMNQNKIEITPNTIQFGKLDDNIMSFNLEKIKDNGEDAEPLIIKSNDKVALFVFDGLGGAGSNKVTIDEEQKTSAYVASRKVRELTKLFFEKSFDQQDIVNEKLILDFKTYVFEELKKYNESLKIKESKIKSNLLKSLPTTIAGFIICIDSEKKLTFNSIWAGDSRNYILTSESGLRQLSVDDLKNIGNAYENLSNDSKMSNFINADNAFEVNMSNHAAIETPAIIFSSTDGAFDYLQTPMHFEYILLKSIEQSESIDDLKNKLISNLKDIVGDDVSMAFIHIGWSTYKSLKKDFKKRENHLYHKFIEPIEKKNSLINEKKNELEALIISISEEKKAILILKNKLWKDYNQTYSELLKNDTEK